MRSRFNAIMLVVGVVAAGTGCSIEISDGIVATGAFERTLEVTGVVDLVVRTGSGSVAVRQGDAGEVRVTGHVRARRGIPGGSSAEEIVRDLEANPPIAHDGNLIRIGNERDEHLRRVSISYELVVPATTRLRARTGSGAIEVQSVEGPVEAHTGSGRLVVGGITGEVTAVTGSGSIDVIGAGQGLTARTGSGAIRAQDLAGSVRTESGSGRIEISYAAPGDAELGTGSGSVDVSGLQGGLRVRTGSGSVLVEGNPTRPWDIETGSGSIGLRLPADAAFELDARGTGAIQTSHPVTASASPERNRLQGEVRGGGPRVTLRTGSGAVRVD